MTNSIGLLSSNKNEILAQYEELEEYERLLRLQQDKRPGKYNPIKLDIEIEHNNDLDANDSIISGDINHIIDAFDAN
jgi:hypothetical protein